MLCSFKLFVVTAVAGSLMAVTALGQVTTKQATPAKAVAAQKEDISGSTMDIVETAVKAGTFKTLATALKAAGLDQTLKGKGPFTVFAPTDEAFAKLPKGTLENLLKPENKKKLAAILTYHVLSGNIKGEEVMDMDSAKTVNGEEVKIKTEGENVTVNNAKVTDVDVACTNGTIHVIDTVLMPKA